MSYIEMCNKKDRSPGSFSRQIRLITVEFGSRFHRRQWERVENTQVFKLRFSFLLKHIHFVYHIIEFFQKQIFYATASVD